MRSSKILGASMLVSCTTIGGGILALPIDTFTAGIIPTSINFLISWLFMTIAALYMLEVSINAKPHANIISIADDLLGATGKFFAWIAYLALLYALMCAFITSISAWLGKFNHLPLFTNNIIISLIFSSIFCSHNHYLDAINKFFSLILFISLIYIITKACTNVDLQVLYQHSIKDTLLATPLIITSFGFAIVIPSINNYLNFDIKKIKLVILIGSTIPLIIYLLWEFSLLGSLNEQLSILSQQHSSNGTEVATALSNTLHTQSITFFADLFSLTSIITSILGVGWSLFDFLADGFKISKNIRGKFLICSIMFIPTVLLINIFPIGFDAILSFGGIFVACLLGILPTILVWQKRSQNKASMYYAPGGAILMCITLIFFVTVILIETYNCLN